MLPAAEVAFGPYRLDSRTRSLSRGGEPVGLSPHEFEVLHLLVRRPDVVASKDALIRAGWQDTAVGDNSLEKLVGKLRRRLDPSDLNRYIKTVARQGYQFVGPVLAVETQAAASDLESLLAPHRAFTEGRVALDSLQCDRISTARATFEHLLQQHPADAAYQIGMANACAMQFEATRTDPAPDVAALRLAESHALNACHIDPHLAEAWAMLGFVLERTGRRADALAALERAVALEPDNWRHQVRLALGSWGETRLRAARRALAQCPQLPLAHWLAATVFVARNALDQAERDVDRALAVAAVESPDAAPYSMVALHWLKGLLRLAAGDAAGAVTAFDHELALEARGHLYSREAAANTWYAKGACDLNAGDRDAARAAFGEAVARVPSHPLAHAGLAILDGQPLPAATEPDTPESVDGAIARTARLVHAHDVCHAVPVVSSALAAAPPGNGGWLLPVEPLLRVGRALDAWAPALAVLHLRAR
ncbi:MAG: winged helix-turn-helix domain-containing protein [Vicinamibacterales bacterium]